MEVLDNEDSVAYAFSKHRLIKYLYEQRGNIYTEEHILKCLINVADQLRIARFKLERILIEQLSACTFAIELDDGFHPLSPKIVDCVNKRGWKILHELGRGGESIAFEIDKMGERAVMIFRIAEYDSRMGTVYKFQKANPIQNTIGYSDLAVTDIMIKILDVIKCNHNVTLAAVNNWKCHPIYIEEKVDLDLAEYIADVKTKLTLNQRLQFAKNVIDVLDKKISTLARSYNYEHNDLNAENIGVIYTDLHGTADNSSLISLKTVELKLIDLSSLERCRVGDEYHQGWLTSIYFSLVIGLELADFRYDDNEMYPIIVKWKSKALNLR